jgi:hypothetical protein
VFDLKRKPAEISLNKVSVNFPVRSRGSRIFITGNQRIWGNTEVVPDSLFSGKFLTSYYLHTQTLQQPQLISLIPNYWVLGSSAGNCTKIIH